MLSRIFAAAALLAGAFGSPDIRALGTVTAPSPTLPLADLSPLTSAIGGARFIALGEATHGTEEFYRERARISEVLIRERDFGGVVIEGDWPETERVNRYVRGLGPDRTAREALSSFTRFPRWMWRNTEFADFIERVRAHNLSRPLSERAGVYGMDVYNLADAMSGAVRHLEQIDPPSATRVRRHYRCFARYKGDTHRYGEAARHRSCQAAAQAALAEAERLPNEAEPDRAELRFAAIRNAAAVAGAEECFRTLYAGSYSWNARDRRMAATVAATAQHVGSMRGRPGRVIVWAHNSMLGMPAPPMR